MSTDSCGGREKPKDLYQSWLDLLSLVPRNFVHTILIFAKLTNRDYAPANDMAERPHPELHTFSSHVEEAAAALGSVYAANEFSKAIKENEDEDDHYLKAAIGTAVAVGAYMRLKDKVDRESKDSGSIHHDARNVHRGESREPAHHTRHLLEEAAGAYSLGKQLLGDKNHHVVRLVAEALGATGLLKDIQWREREQDRDRSRSRSRSKSRE